MIRTLKTTLLLRLGIAQGKPLPTTLWASATSRIKIVKMKQLKSHTWGCHCLCPVDVMDPIGFCLAEIGEPTFSQEGLLMTMEVRPEQGAILQRLRSGELDIGQLLKEQPAKDFAVAEEAVASCLHS
jgi:hypothetical protein